uniref:Dynactin subunit 6 n=2 Tax=Cyprinus carpio TaxID=7962 RepID=A0A9J7XSC2_CYPCA
KKKAPPCTQTGFPVDECPKQGRPAPLHSCRVKEEFYNNRTHIYTTLYTKGRAALPCVVRHYVISASLHTRSSSSFVVQSDRVFACTLNRIRRGTNHALQSDRAQLDRLSYPENILPDAEDVEPKTMSIGINNVFEVGCVSQALKIGDNNVIESKAEVGRNVILSSGCIVGACCQVNTCEVIQENTVIYGSECLRRVQTERPQPQTLQLDFLMKILPNYHHLKKTVKGNSTPARS